MFYLRQQAETCLRATRFAFFAIRAWTTQAGHGTHTQKSIHAIVQSLLQVLHGVVRLSIFRHGLDGNSNRAVKFRPVLFSVCFDLVDKFVYGFTLALPFGG
jgi:hypothetical protein